MMRVRFSCLVLIGLAAAAPALALDGKPQPVEPLPQGAFKSVGDAFRSGMREYNAGEKNNAIRALEYAAGQGHTLARWKLGRMYADGDGVPADSLKAFEFFSKIADEHADESPDSANARFVSSAFVALGSYHLSGIPDTYVKANPERAKEMFNYAASWFGDADAQYNLARMNLDGVGCPRDPKQALRWFHLSAEKGHVQSQAMLGHLLFTGEAGMRQRGRGLMWLTLARDNANPRTDVWIFELHEKAMAASGDHDRNAALAYLEKQMKKK